MEFLVVKSQKLSGQTLRFLINVFVSFNYVMLPSPTSKNLAKFYTNFSHSSKFKINFVYKIFQFSESENVFDSKAFIFLSNFTNKHREMFESFIQYFKNFDLYFKEHILKFFQFSETFKFNFLCYLHLTALLNLW